jgi:hypothetical protein
VGIFHLWCPYQTPDAITTIFTYKTLNSNIMIQPIHVKCKIMIVTRINNYNSVVTYYDIIDYNATKYVPLFSHIPKKTTAAI